VHEDCGVVGNALFYLLIARIVKVEEHRNKIACSSRIISLNKNWEKRLGKLLQITPL